VRARACLSFGVRAVFLIASYVAVDFICLFFSLCERRFCMAKRGKMQHGYSKKVFRRGAQRIHAKNVSPAPMRGGIRL
jgi:hypothetical protein